MPTRAAQSSSKQVLKAVCWFLISATKSCTLLGAVASDGQQQRRSVAVTTAKARQTQPVDARLILPEIKVHNYKLPG